MPLPKNISYLVVEDLVSDSVLIQRQFKQISQDHDLRFVDNQLSLRNAIKSYVPDFVVSDYSLDGWDAFDVIATVKDINEHIPVIVITGNVKNKEAIDNLYEAGAIGFFLKDPMNSLHERLKPLFEELFDSDEKRFINISHKRRTIQSIKELSDYDRAFGKQESKERKEPNKFFRFFSKKKSPK